PTPAALAVEQCRQEALQEECPAHRTGRIKPKAHGLLPGDAEVARVARGCLHYQLRGNSIGPWPMLAKRREEAIDELWVLRCQSRIVQSQNPRLLRVGIVEHHISVTCQPLHDLLAGG